MNNHWTGLQYSIYRASLAGAWALVFFSNQRFFMAGVFRMAGQDSAALDIAATAVAAALGLCLAVGLFDRAFALVLAALTAFLAAQDPWGHTGTAPQTALLLLFHFYTAPMPYGSLAARGRADPGGGWRLSPNVFLAAWFLWGATWACAGISALINADTGYRLLLAGTPDEARLGLGIAMLGWSALAVTRRGRPFAWMISAALSGMLFAADGLFFGGLPGRFAGLVALSGLCFDPGWIRPRRSASFDRLFFDGDCGLCRLGVRFAIAEDARGDAFRFAPLGGETFTKSLSAQQRETLPDSFVILTGEGVALAKSRAVLRVLSRLGGWWRLAGALLWLIPRPVRDLLYDVIAWSREMFFRAPGAACPVGGDKHRERFDP